MLQGLSLTTADTVIKKPAHWVSTSGGYRSVTALLELFEMGKPETTLYRESFGYEGRRKYRNMGKAGTWGFDVKDLCDIGNNNFLALHISEGFEDEVVDRLNIPGDTAATFEIKNHKYNDFFGVPIFGREEVEDCYDKCEDRPEIGCRLRFIRKDGRMMLFSEGRVGNCGGDGQAVILPGNLLTSKAIQKAGDYLDGSCIDRVMACMVNCDLPRNVGAICLIKIETSMPGHHDGEYYIGNRSNFLTLILDSANWV